MLRCGKASDIEILERGFDEAWASFKEGETAEM
jgi:hypothetical protein